MSFVCMLCAGAIPRALFEKQGLGYVICKACGLVQRHPVPTIAELRRAYGEETIYADRLQKEAQVFLDRERALLSALAAQGASGPLLDIGAGAGLILQAALERGWSAAGVELSAPSARAIRERLGVPVSADLLEDSAFADGSFGTITASHSLEHLRQPGAVLERCYRLLRPGGTLHLAVPNWRSAKRLAAGKHVSWIYADHLSYFDRRTLALLVRRAGFEIRSLRVENFTGGPDYFFLVGLWRRWGLERCVQRFLRLGDLPLERLIGDDLRLACPPWRFRAVLRAAKLTLALWPARLARFCGLGDELRLTARKPEVAP